MKRLIFSLSIDEEKKQFMVDDNIRKSSLNEMNAIIGFISQYLHNIIHIQTERMNIEALEEKKKN